MLQVHLGYQCAGACSANMIGNAVDRNQFEAVLVRVNERVHAVPLRGGEVHDQPVPA